MDGVLPGEGNGKSGGAWIRRLVVSLGSHQLDSTVPRLICGLAWVVQGRDGPREHERIGRASDSRRSRYAPNRWSSELRLPRRQVQAVVSPETIS